MKKYTYSILFIFFLSILISNAQTHDFYYTTNNDKVSLIKIEGKYLAEFPNGINTPNNTNISNHPGLKISDKTYIVSDSDNLNNYNLNRYLTPTYITNDGLEVNYTREIMLKFKDDASFSNISNLITNYNLTLQKSELTYEMYQVVGDALQTSKLIYLSGLVEYCIPNFLTNVEQSENYNIPTSLVQNCSPIHENPKDESNINSSQYYPNDTYFNKQWYLHNEGQGTNDAKSTTVDADIDAPEAWEITKGSQNVIIAVIDDGVTSNHPDLPNTRQVRLNGSNFAYLVDGTNNPNDPSPTISTTKSNRHGNACAGIIAATQDNNEGISGIAPNCKIMPIKVQFGTGSTISMFVDAINFATSNGADIISNSWGFNSTQQNLYPPIAAAIMNAINNGKFVVFSAGNNANRVAGNNGYLSYPGNIPAQDLITVGASDRNNNPANYTPYSNGTPNWPNPLEIVAPSHTAYNTQISGEAFNIWTIDNPSQNYGCNSWKVSDDIYQGLPAVGEILPAYGTNNSAYSGRMGGTSAAAPQVAGVLALIKSINPCLNYSQIKNILLSTTDKIGGVNYNWHALAPGHSKELGYGKVNAHKAVLLAQQMNSTTVDLMVRDNTDDFGIQPNTTSQIAWDSPDIWVRNYNDGIEVQEHENPKYNSNGSQNYIYVRITNKSCVASSGTEELKIYFALSKSFLTWPNSWSEIAPTGSINIPVIQPGSEYIATIPWNVPNPSSFPTNNLSVTGSNRFALLARIESNVDVMAFPETGTVQGVTNNGKLRFYANVQNNNNIAWKNSIIIDIANGNKGFITLENQSNQIQNSYLELIKKDLEYGKPIYEEAEISLNMDQTLFDAWERGGKIAQQIDVTTEEKKRIVKGNNVILENISLNPNETGVLQIDFNFLTQEATNKDTYTYYIIQKDTETGQIIGGETFKIKKEPRPVFMADAGEDLLIDKNEPITISAAQIGEAAIYNWYDINGNLIFSGKDLSVSTDVAQKYKLEVIAISDGFKDYSEVEVKIKPSSISLISPNPANNLVNIRYKLNNVNSAYLIFLNNYGAAGISNNYILDTNVSETNINVSNYPNGLYTVALVCDGQIVDAKTLIKQ